MQDAKIFKGWEFSFDYDEQEAGGPKVYNFYLNKGDQSASLPFAIETETDSSCDEPIDKAIIKAACEYADSIDPEGDWLEYYENYNN